MNPKTRDWIFNVLEKQESNHSANDPQYEPGKVIMLPPPPPLFTIRRVCGFLLATLPCVALSIALILTGYAWLVWGMIIGVLVLLTMIIGVSMLD